VPRTHDDQLLRRFLLGEVSPEERDRVEQAYMEDSAVFDALSAAEDELILLHLRNELPEALRDRFRSAVLESPARRRRVDEMKALVDAAEALGDTSAERQPWWWPPRGVGLVLAGSAALLLLSIGWMLRQGPPPATRQQPPAVAGGSGTATPSVAAVFLVPGLTRADLRQSNVFRIPSGTASIQFRLLLPGGTLPGARAQLRPVGGEPLAAAGELTVRTVADGVELTWAVPANVVPPGDYLLTISAETPPGGRRESITSRFFSIVQ